MLAGSRFQARERCLANHNCKAGPSLLSQSRLPEKHIPDGLWPGNSLQGLGCLRDDRVVLGVPAELRSNDSRGLHETLSVALCS